MATVSEERVLVVPTDLFHELGHFQGFSTDTQRYLARLLDPANTSYRARADVEQDPSFKQLIPYVIFRYRDPLHGEMVFQYTRGKGQGEGRLHSKRSVGIGGHISADDHVSDECVPYEAGMRRELLEEVQIDGEYQDRCVGLINDDETEVGRVHLGVVHIIDLEQPNVSSRETDILESGFRSVRDLLNDIDQFETWSQICLRALFTA